jgi:tetratricopeptide (TPR) repeat protein
MNRILTILSFLIFTGFAGAQQPADYLIKARALTGSGKAREAIDLLSHGLTKIQDFRFFLERAEAYMSEGDYIKASDDFNTASSLAPFSGEYGISRIFALKRDAVNSLKHLENCISSEYKKSEKEIMLDPAFSLIENSPEWRQFWKKERYSLAERKISEIEYYVSTGKVDDASSSLDELAKAYPQDPATDYARSLVFFSRGKYNESIALLSHLPEKDRLSEACLRLMARAQSASANPSGASKSYSDLIENGVIDATLYLSRAECYSKTGETEKAIKDVSKFLEFFPENKKAISFAGRLEAQAGDNFKAIDYFTENIKLHPGDPECYIDRGNAFYVSKTWDSAINDYAMALDIQPSNPDAWLNKGNALISLGKTTDACHDFRVAMTLGNKKAANLISRYCIK